MGGGCIFDNNLVKNLFNSPDSITPKNNCSNKDNQNNQNDIQQNGGNITNFNKTHHILTNILENSPDRKSMRKRYSYFPNNEKTQDVNFSNMQNMGYGISYYEGKNSPNNDPNMLNQYNNYEENKKYNGNSLSPTRNSRLKMHIIKEEEEYYNSPENRNKLSNANNFNLISENNSRHHHIIQKIKVKDEDKQKNGTNVNLGENNFIFININRGSALIHKNEIERLKSTTPKMILDKETLEEMSKGNKKLFSHFCKNKMSNNDNNYLKNKKIIKNVFIHSFDMNRYSEEMLKVINTIRLNPKSFIKDIDDILNNNIQKTDEGIFLINHDIEEKIKLMNNYLEMFELTKNFLKQMGDSTEILSKLGKLEYNDDLEIIFDESNYEEIYPEVDIKDLPSKLNLIYEENGIDETVDIDDDSEQNIYQYNENINVIDFDEEDEKEQLKDKDKDKVDKENNKNNINDNVKNIINNNINNEKEIVHKKKFGIKRKKNINSTLDLNDDKIANLILQKRKEIKKRYPNNIFKISVIKEIRTSILVQILMEELFKEENRKSIKDIIFDPQYKYFSVSWTNEINRNFLSISCFA